MTKNDKIDSIINCLTIKQKIGQLMQVNGACFADSDSEITGPAYNLQLTLDELYSVGSVLTYKGISALKKIQNNYSKYGENEIPLLFMDNAVEGYRTFCPSTLALACSFDMDLVENCAAMVAKESIASGVKVTFSPQVDVVRDARWGRVSGCAGEDTYLCCLVAKAQVKGYQRHSDKFAACVKHFAAYGAAESGRDYNTTDMSERTLREVYLPPYKAAIDAGAKLVMVSFNTVDGIPATTNKKLIDGILRKEWGFDGVVISDYAGISETIKHGYSLDAKDAAYKAFDAGVDIEMMSSTYAHHLKELVQEGKISEKQLNQSVKRVLKLKADLGLFDDEESVVFEEKEKALQFTEANRQIALTAAENSAVLLKNNGVLPFSEAVKTIAVIGPYGKSGELLSSYYCAGNVNETVSVYNGIKKLKRAAKVKFLKGCDFYLESKKNGILEAAELAKKSEAVIVCIGEPAKDSGEGNSKTNLDLSEVQYKLLEKVMEVNPNTAVVLFTGRPLTIVKLDRIAPAILNMWLPGTEGGTAAARLLFGKSVPSGKLAMSFPYHVGQCPIYYNHFNTGRPRENDSKRCPFQSAYIDSPNEPLYPFGYGLSYSEFEYGEVKVSSDKMTIKGRIIASVDVKNVGCYTAKEVVQLYVKDVCGSVVRPVRELKGFKKVELKPNESTEVSFEIDEKMLEFYSADGRKRAEKGTFLIFIGTDSRCKRHSSFELI